MQRTRLNTLFNQAILQFRQWVFNPWRRLAVLVMSLLFGNFFATAISATAGQTAELDVLVSAFLVVGVEVVSWLYYRFTPRRPLRSLDQPGAMTVSDAGVGLAASGVEVGPVRSRSTLIEAFNSFKLGMVYGLFVEAFKLGS